MKFTLTYSIALAGFCLVYADEKTQDVRKAQDAGLWNLLASFFDSIRAPITTHTTYVPVVPDVDDDIVIMTTTTTTTTTSPVLNNLRFNVVPQEIETPVIPVVSPQIAIPFNQMIKPKKLIKIIVSKTTTTTTTTTTGRHFLALAGISDTVSTTPLPFNDSSSTTSSTTEPPERYVDGVVIKDGKSSFCKIFIKQLDENRLQIITPFNIFITKNFTLLPDPVDTEDVVPETLQYAFRNLYDIRQDDRSAKYIKTPEGLVGFFH